MAPAAAYGHFETAPFGTCEVPLSLYLHPLRTCVRRFTHGAVCRKRLAPMPTADGTGSGNVSTPNSAVWGVRGTIELEIIIIYACEVFVGQTARRGESNSSMQVPPGALLRCASEAPSGVLTASRGSRIHCMQ